MKQPIDRIKDLENAFCASLGVETMEQALEYINKRVRPVMESDANKPPQDSD